MYKAEVILKSKNPYNGVEITTLRVKYPLAIHAEVMTHRVFSRNAESNRAIPSKTLIKRVWNNPYTPLEWQKNKSGMQSSEDLSTVKKWFARKVWITSSKLACLTAFTLNKLGLHKQWANRVLNPYQWVEVIITSTEWENFFNLRCHEDAQPEIRKIAEMMRDAINGSESVEREWHIPFADESLPVYERIKKSVEDCARVSYGQQSREGRSNYKLYEQLVIAKPLHASPAEHQARAVKSKGFIRNLRGWKMHRVELERNYYEKISAKRKTMGSQ